MGIQLLDNLLKFDPHKRYTLKDALNDPFLKDVRDKKREIMKTWDEPLKLSELNDDELKELISYEISKYNTSSNIVIQLYVNKYGYNKIPNVILTLIQQFYGLSLS